MSSQFVQNSLSKLSSRVFTIRLKLTFQVVFACFTMKLISLLLPFVLLIGFLSGVQAKNARANTPTLEEPTLEPHGEQAVQINAILTIGAILLGMAYEIRHQMVGRSMTQTPRVAGSYAAMNLAPGQITADFLATFFPSFHALVFSLLDTTTNTLVLSVWNDVVRDLLSEGVAIGTIHAIRQYMEGYMEAGPYSTAPFPHFSYVHNLWEVIISPPSDDEDEDEDEDNEDDDNEDDDKEDDDKEEDEEDEDDDNKEEDDDDDFNEFLSSVIGDNTVVIIL